MIAEEGGYYGGISGEGVESPAARVEIPPRVVTVTASRRRPDDLDEEVSLTVCFVNSTSGISRKSCWTLTISKAGKREDLRGGKRSWHRVAWPRYKSEGLSVSVH